MSYQTEADHPLGDNELREASRSEASLLLICVYKTNKFQTNAP